MQSSRRSGAIMEAVLSQQRAALAFAAFVIGIAVFWLTDSP